MSARDRLIERLAHASARGQLGLFVGSGFSIGLTAGDGNGAPSWRQLLERVASRLGLSMPTPEQTFGSAFPRIATNMIGSLRERERQKAEAEGEEAMRIDVLRRATWQFKSTIAELCHFEVAAGERVRWRDAISTLDPAWVVTTNYDLLIEDLIPNSTLLLPDDLLTIPRGGPLPVFHLHGHRLAPDSLVISDEDYTRLFRPGDYRQRKLSLLFSESVVLVLGYGFGDVNVMSAIDLAGSYSQASEHIGVVIQALWKGPDALDEPYPGILGETILEISDIPELLDAIGTRKQALLAELSTHAATVDRLIADEAARADLVGGGDTAIAYWTAMRSDADLRGNRKVLSALSIVLDELWAKGRQDGGFAYYEAFLRIVLGGFEFFGNERAHPAVLSLLTNRLADVAPYIDPENKNRRGYSWSASQMWARAKRRLSPALVFELHARANTRGSNSVRALLPQLGSRDFPYWPRCPACGASASNLKGSQSFDDDHGDSYFSIECMCCGWETGGEM